MKIPSFRRIFKTDYKAEEQELVEKLSGTINNGFEVLHEALGKKVSLRDNLQCTVKDVDIIVDSSGVPLTNTGISRDIPGRIEGMTVIDANNLTTSTTYPSSGVFVNFIPNDNGALITHVTGLQTNNKYRLRIIAWIN